MTSSSSTTSCSPKLSNTNDDSTSQHKRQRFKKIHSTSSENSHPDDQPSSSAVNELNGSF